MILIICVLIRNILYLNCGVCTVLYWNEVLFSDNSLYISAWWQNCFIVYLISLDWLKCYFDQIYIIFFNPKCLTLLESTSLTRCQNCYDSY